MVLSHFGMPNQVAHGNLAATRIDVSRVVQDFHVIQGVLTRQSFTGLPDFTGRIANARGGVSLVRRTVGLSPMVRAGC
jgi:hypothetical protein